MGKRIAKERSLSRDTAFTKPVRCRKGLGMLEEGSSVAASWAINRAAYMGFEI